LLTLLKEEKTDRELQLDGGLHKKKKIGSYNPINGEI